MKKETIIIKRSHFENLLKTLDRQTTTFYLKRMPAGKKDGDCRCSTASELVAFHVREAIIQVTRSFCRLAGVEFPIPYLFRGQDFKKQGPSPKQEGDQE
ncbi:MAG: hypothetical protein ISS66_05525 [Desulfobacteraceae bacterium]|nr:hypothetical protein [Desulfobacteraceae bacterium]